jgi:hypothetical protein
MDKSDQERGRRHSPNRGAQNAGHLGANSSSSKLRERDAWDAFQDYFNCDGAFTRRSLANRESEFITGAWPGFQCGRSRHAKKREIRCAVPVFVLAALTTLEDARPGEIL